MNKVLKIEKWFAYCMFIFVVSAFDNGGFIFISPKKFLSGSEENVCITFRNQSATPKIRIAVLEQKQDNDIASTVEELTKENRGTKCFKVTIPRTKVEKARIQLTIQSKAEKDFKINYIEQISLQPNPDVTVIQTDKSIYSGSHIVRFRIFTFRSDLTPVLRPVEKIWIENPNGICLAQWTNVSTDTGFINKTFQLAAEPFTGKWFIKVKHEDEDIVSQSFLVENYILPKFFVNIKTTDLLKSTSTNVTVCAKYMFGEPVHGVVFLRYYMKCSFSYYCLENESSVSRKLKLNSDGCVEHQIVLKGHTSFVRSLIVNATVVESGTRVKAIGTAEIDIKNSKKAILPEFSSATKQSKFKPGLPFKGQVVFKNQPDFNERILICFNTNDNNDCRDFAVNRSTTNFVILPVPVRDEQNFKSFLEVKSIKDSSRGTFNVKLNLVPWYSPSGSYLKVESLSPMPVRCNEKARINVLYTSPVQTSFQFHYMVKSRGDILTQGILDQFSKFSEPFDVHRYLNLINYGDVRNVMQFQFYVDVKTTMSPQSQLLVYFVLDNGEVVADTLRLTVEKCFPNKVQTKWIKNSVSPGQLNNFVIEAFPNSICGLTVADKSTKILSNQEEFKKESIFKAIEKFEVKSHISENNAKRCKTNTEIEEQSQSEKMQALSTFFEPDSNFVDSLQAFKDFGALVITDLNLETRPCKEKKSREILMRNATTRSGILPGSEIENISIFQAEEFENEDVGELNENSLAEEIRSYFPETWIWDLIHVDNSGTAEMNFRVPHSLTEWTANTICLSLNKGLGMADSSKLVTYKSFFLDFSMPRSLNRKEVFHLQVSVFNYDDSDLPVKLTLGPLKNFMTRSEDTSSYCIKSKMKMVHRFVLEPVRLGEAEITVKAETDFQFRGLCGAAITKKSDVVIKQTIVKYEGFPVEDVKAGFICGENAKFGNQVSWNIKIPHDIIESSISVKALVSGDILGPPLKNVHHLITLPTGCGEQNMILLIPNLLLLDYLLREKSNELESIEKALKNLDVGYQRQLTYKRPDGSYSAFGEKDEKGSIWLTAFVVRYLSHAKKYIHVDENDLNATTAWVLKQQLENGCFPMMGKIYHREFQEKVNEEDSSKTLTAYILISIIESGISIENPVVRNAIFCLKATEESLGLYGDLLLSYALILAGEYRESQALMIELLKDAKRSYGMLWWENDDSIESAIEMTAYGILCLIKLGGPHFMAAASDGIRWIVQYENQNGGFISSQDTVLALEAISKFSSKLPKTSEHDELKVQVEASGEKHLFDISYWNKTVQQSIDLPPFLTNVRFESSGIGCALVQTWVKYNVRRFKGNDNLKIQLKIHSVSDIDKYSIARFHVCVRYRSPGKKINMAVLEVSMVSGYYPDRASLYGIKTSRKEVRRWEEYEDRVNFYFEDLKNRRVCSEFLAVQEACVENTSPAAIKLYDYYNRKHQTTIKYNIIRKCQNDSWSDTSSYQIKQESKRELRFSNGDFLPIYKEDNYNDENRFLGFVDFSQDLETPKGEERSYPVFALPPHPDVKDQYCPHCMPKVSDIFPKLYCSSNIAVKVLILSKQTLEFQMDVSPRANFTSLKKAVSITMKPHCDCQILNSVNTFALLLVTPPRVFRVKYLQELHIDDSVQLYPWGNPNDLPDFLSGAYKFCQKEIFNNDY